GDGTVAPPPARPGAAERGGGLLGLRPGGKKKGSPSGGGFSRHFPAKVPHPARMAGKSAAIGAACSRSTLVEYVEKVPPVRPIRIEAALPPYARGLESEIPCLLRRSLSRGLAQVRPHSIATRVCVRRRGQRH